jgi:RNA polymerase sigma factor (sigma-70 family)
MRRGDLEAKRELVVCNVRLVVRIAGWFTTTHDGFRSVSFDDLVQCGMVGLERAARKFDPEREVRFATYATWWIRREMQRAVTNECVTFYDEKTGQDEDPADTVQDVKYVRDAVSLLEPRDREVIELRYGFDGTQGRTVDDVARVTGLTSSKVKHAQRRALTRLRELVIDSTTYGARAT